MPQDEKITDSDVTHLEEDDDPEALAGNDADDNFDDSDVDYEALAQED